MHRQRQTRDFGESRLRKYKENACVEWGVVQREMHLEARNAPGLTRAPAASEATLKTAFLLLLFNL